MRDTTAYIHRILEACFMAVHRSSAQLRGCLLKHARALGRTPQPLPRKTQHSATWNSASAAVMALGTTKKP